MEKYISIIFEAIIKNCHFSDRSIEEIIITYDDYNILYKLEKEFYNRFHNKKYKIPYDIFRLDNNIVCNQENALK